MLIRELKRWRRSVLSYLRAKRFNRKIDRLRRGRAPYRIGFGAQGSLDSILQYVLGLSSIENGAHYRYCYSSTQPLLYASVYSAMLRHLLGGFDYLPEQEKRKWADHINSFQCDDGLYRDPALQCDIAEQEDWWGWRHLSGHVVTALTALGEKTRIPFRFLEDLYGEGRGRSWIDSLDWANRPDFVSNTVMNYGVALQYDRDFHGVREAASTLDEIFGWLDEKQDPRTGLWMSRPPETPRDLSLGIQTAYHIWILYFYDRRPVNHIETSIDSCLRTQNAMGGFGVGLNSSACEDIDSIDPLCRFYYLSEYRREDIVAALEKAVPWIFANQNEDGGFVFKRFEPLEYGHALMTSGPDESCMFPTWFRTLSLAYISRVIQWHPAFAGAGFSFVRCPGYQFWFDR